MLGLDATFATSVVSEGLDFCGRFDRRGAGARSLIFSFLADVKRPRGLLALDLLSAMRQQVLDIMMADNDSRVSHQMVKSCRGVRAAVAI